MKLGTIEPERILAEGQQVPPESTRQPRRAAVAREAVQGEIRSERVGECLVRLSAAVDDLLRGGAARGEVEVALRRMLRNVEFGLRKD